MPQYWYPREPAPRRPARAREAVIVVLFLLAFVAFVALLGLFVRPAGGYDGTGAPTPGYCWACFNQPRNAPPGEEEPQEPSYHAPAPVEAPPEGRRGVMPGPTPAWGPWDYGLGANF